TAGSHGRWWPGSTTPHRGHSDDHGCSQHYFMKSAIAARFAIPTPRLGGVSCRQAEVGVEVEWMAGNEVSLPRIRAPLMPPHLSQLGTLLRSNASVNYCRW